MDVTGLFAAHKRGDHGDNELPHCPWCAPTDPSMWSRLARGDLYEVADSLGDEPFTVELFTTMGVIRITLSAVLALEAARTAEKTLDNDDGELKHPVIIGDDPVERVHVIDGLTWFWDDELSGVEPIGFVADDGSWVVQPASVQGVRITDGRETGAQEPVTRIIGFRPRR